MAGYGRRGEDALEALEPPEAAPGDRGYTAFGGLRLDAGGVRLRDRRRYGSLVDRFQVRRTGRWYLALWAAVVALLGRRLLLLLLLQLAMQVLLLLRIALAVRRVALLLLLLCV